MGRIIGFVDFPQAWEGPAVLEFTLVSLHTKTARYQSELEQRTFDLYAPLFILPNPGTPPQHLLVALGKAPGTLRTISFLGEAKPLRIAPHIGEFELDREMANSKRYCLLHEGQKYYLYIPNEVFAKDDPPARVFLQVAVPGEQPS